MTEMTEKKPMLTAAEAAEYLGCKNVAQFKREVAQSIWPKPLADSHKAACDLDRRRW